MKGKGKGFFLGRQVWLWGDSPYMTMLSIVSCRVVSRRGGPFQSHCKSLLRTNACAFYAEDILIGWLGRGGGVGRSLLMQLLFGRFALGRGIWWIDVSG